ncbi:MAG: preprotein translocase subunit SecD [Patescibacteria group bacterium]|nr:preprotein translocase subunit SecD [Patescibacteria group bacterium]
MRYIPAVLVLLVSGFLGWYVLSPGHPIKLGLDLAGGTELIYRADTSLVQTDKQGALNALREVIERRVNLFGVAEPLVQLEQSSAVAGAVEDRLLVELPGVTDVQAAVDAIGATPSLEFRLAAESTTATSTFDFMPTELTGRYLEKADLQFGSQSGAGVANEPIVVLTFTAEGAALFEQITRDNVGNTLAIYLDGEPISTPVIREAIAGGTATVSGGFTPEEARNLVRNLNFGALPVPIELVGSGTVGPTLGAEAYEAGLIASALGFLLVALFMILWYRLPGFIASVALVIYMLITVAVIKFMPITLTTSGIAALILSIGMAVDANVLIFERMKEELRRGEGAHDAVRIGFARAWTAIRDGHFTMLISSVILFWIGTPLVQGFALVFGFGVIASLISAVSITRVFLLAIVPEEASPLWRFLLGTGLYRHNRSEGAST